MSMAADTGFNPQHRNAPRIGGKWATPSASASALIEVQFSSIWSRPRGNRRLQSGPDGVKIQPCVEGKTILNDGPAAAGMNKTTQKEGVNS